MPKQMPKRTPTQMTKKTKTLKKNKSTRVRKIKQKVNHSNNRKKKTMRRKVVKGGSTAFDAVQSFYNDTAMINGQDNLAQQSPINAENKLNTMEIDILKSNYQLTGGGRRSIQPIKVKPTNKVKSSSNKSKKTHSSKPKHKQHKSRKTPLGKQRKLRKLLKRGGAGEMNTSFSELNPQSWDTNYIDNSRPSKFGDSTMVGATIPTNVVQKFNSLLGDSIMKDSYSNPMNYDCAQLQYNNSSKTNTSNNFEIPSFVGANTEVKSILNPSKIETASVMSKAIPTPDGFKISDVDIPAIIG